MLTKLSKLVSRRPWLVLAAGLLVMIAGGVYGTGVFGDLKSGGFDDPTSDYSKALTTMERELGYSPWSIVVLFTAQDGLKVNDPAYRQEVESTLGKLNGQSAVKGVTSYYSTGATQLVSKDHWRTYALVDLHGTEAQQAENLARLRPLLTSNRLQVQLGGSAPVTLDIGDQVGTDIALAESLTFPIVAVLLILVFGSLVAASLPLAIGGLSILGAFLILKIASNFTEISIFAVNVITMLGLGLAIDYSLFVVSRFREELVRNDNAVLPALKKTMQTAGRTVLFSGTIITLSLLSLVIFPQMFLKSMGLGSAAAVLVAMLASITVLPAALYLLGKRVNSLSIWRLFRRKTAPATVEEAAPRKTFWYNLSHFVMRRPTIILLAAMAVMLWAGLPFLRVNFSMPDARNLPAGRESRVVSELLNTEFAPNETSPVQLVVHRTGPLLSDQGIKALYDYTRQIEAVKGVRRVDSLVTLDPQLNLAAYQAFYSEANRANDAQAARAAERSVKNDYTLVSVLYDTDLLSSASQQLVRDLRAVSPPAGLQVVVGGDTAQLVDFLKSMEHSVPFVFGSVVLIIFVLLFAMLGSLVVPLKAILLNILSLSASFGALVWVFQDGNLADILGFTPLGSVDGTQPVLIFAIAFGLSMDYEVFLLSRIKEQYDLTGNTKEAVAWGIQKTGRIITCAALLLVIVIGAFATGQIVFIKQIGLGLGLAVLLDATIVRMLLVPATMQLMGKYNWWAPAPLKRLYNRLGLSETETSSTQAAPLTEPAREKAPAEVA